MANAYRKLNDLTLNASIGSTTSTLIEDYLQYGVAEAEVEALDDLNSAFAAAVSLQQILDDQKLAATADKNDKRDIVIDAAYNLIEKIYANPAVDDAMLLKAGLSPRPVPSGARAPLTVTGLLAKPFADGTVELKWNRSGNSVSITFVVEVQTNPDGPFNAVVSTTSTKIKLNGFAPGEPVTFRVRATRGTTSSAPSNLASIYGDGSFELFVDAA